MNNQKVFIITVLLNFSWNLIQDIQESDGTQLFIYPIMKVVSCIFILIKDFIVKGFQCESIFWTIVRNFSILMILGIEEDNSQEKLKMIQIKYTLLGIFFGAIINKDEQIKGWGIAMEINFYSLLLILTLTLNIHETDQINYSLLFYLILLAIPQLINQIFLIKKQKNIQKKQPIQTPQVFNIVNQDPQQHAILRIENIENIPHEDLSNTIRKEESKNILFQNIVQSIEVIQDHAVLFCDEKDKDFQMVHSIKQNKHDLIPQFDSKNKKTLHFYKNFYNLFQKHSADGTIIDCIIIIHLGLVFIDNNENIIYVNKAMSCILGIYQKIDILLILFDLKNCRDEFQEEMQFKQLFRGLSNKLSKKNVQFINQPIIIQQNNVQRSESDDCDSLDENEQDSEKNIVSGQTVRNEYLKALNATKVLFQKQSIVSQNNSNVLSQKNKTFYESKLICRLGIQQENIEDDDQNKLLEISIKSLIFNDQPCVQIMARDVTLFNRFTVLKKINQNKSNMLSQVTHEFRQPLNIIISFSQNCMEKYVSNQSLCEQFLEPIFTSASQLLSLVNDLLDLAQLKAGKFSIVNQDFDLNKLINDIQKLLLPQATVRNLYLKFINGENIPHFINSDPNRIKQIIINLISNSLKFTIKGGIMINLSNEGSNYYKISVTDTGIGINIEDQSRLFQAFGKLEGSNHLNQQGVGLGLMISHVMAQKLSQTYKDEITQGLVAYSEGNNEGTQFNFLVFDQSSMSKAKFNESKQPIHVSKSSKFDLYNFQISSSGVSQKQIYDQQSFQEIKREMQVEKQLISPSFQQISQQRQNSIKMVSRISNNSIFMKKTRNQKMQPIEIHIEGEDQLNFSPKGFNSIKLDIGSTKYWMNQCYCKEILIVDDEPFNIKAVSYTLEKLNLKFISVQQFIILYKKATSGQQAINLLNAIKNQGCCQWIRIILMDIEMPIQDGFQTTIQIRKMEKEIQHIKNFRPAYIIGCSGHGDDIKQQCLDKGMNDYLSKPINKQQLLKIIEDLIFDFKNSRTSQKN